MLIYSQKHKKGYIHCPKKSRFISCQNGWYR